MKNDFLNIFQNRIKVHVKGKNIERFIKRLVSLNIDLYNIEYIKYNEINILVKKAELDQLEQVKTIYEVDVVEHYGLYRFKEFCLKNRYIFFSFFIGLVLFFFLINTIFEVEIIHTDKSLRNLLQEELEVNGISIGKRKKSYDEIESIKKIILGKYKDRIEWLEIENIGTKYIVRVEERILNDEKEVEQNQDIVAKKSAILLKIEAESGEIVKNINDYVKAGDTVITGNIKLNEEVKKQIAAKGKIYGEVWYQTTIEYPLHYREEKETGREKNVLTFQFLNKRIELFNFDVYSDKRIDSKTILKHNLLPFSLFFEHQKELDVIDEVYTKEEAIKKATDAAREKIESQLKDKEKIIRIQQLKVQENNSTIILDLFFTVMEDITDTKPLEEVIEENVSR